MVFNTGFVENRVSTTLGRDTVLFLNTKDSLKTEDIIRQNLIEIRNSLLKVKTDFIFLPEMYNRTEQSLIDEFRNYYNYYFPFLVNDTIAEYELNNFDYNHYAAELLEIKDEQLPCFVYIDFSEKKHILQIDDTILKNPISSQLIEFINSFEIKESILFSHKRKKTILPDEVKGFSEISNRIEFDSILGDDYPSEQDIKYKKINDGIGVTLNESCKLPKEEIKENRFNEEIERISNEVMNRLFELNQPNALKFFIELMNRRILDETGKSTISRMFIDSNYQIFLLDYGKIKIELTPLQKTVYFFFLNHPEGIYCSDFYDYRDEIMTIYKELSHRSTWDAIIESVDDLAAPYSSSMSEKISRIRNEFTKHIAPHLTEKYIIWGERRERKKIILDRNLVTFERKPAFVNYEI